MCGVANVPDVISVANAAPCAMHTVAILPCMQKFADSSQHVARPADENRMRSGCAK